MTRCKEFYIKWEKDPNWCQKCPKTVRQINAYFTVIGELEARGVSKDTVYKYLTERAARPIITLKDTDLRDKVLVKIAESIKQNQKLSLHDVKNLVSATKIKLSDIRSGTMVPLNSSNSGKEERIPLVKDELEARGAQRPVGAQDSACLLSVPLDVSPLTTPDILPAHMPCVSAKKSCNSGGPVSTDVNQAISNKTKTPTEILINRSKEKPSQILPWQIPIRPLSDSEREMFITDFMRFALTSEQKEMVRKMMKFFKFTSEKQFLNFVILVVNDWFMKSFHSPYLIRS